MMEGFPVIAPVEVRWRDLDPMAHVNNAVYFTYFEMARSRYVDAVLGARRIEDINFILASVRCDFVSPAVFGETLEVGIRVAGVGRTSFDFDYEIRSVEDSRVVARGRSTQVFFDYARGEKMPVADDWLDKVAAAQGQRPERHA